MMVQRRGWITSLTLRLVLHFANGRTERKGSTFLCLCRGLAQGVLGNLAYDTQMDYDALVQALNDRFAPPDQMELYRIQLKERRQRASETLPELAQHVRRLTNLAYPTVPADVKETLAKDHFIDALLDSDLRLKIKQARPRSLNDAVRHAVELEAYVKAESKLTESQGVLKSVSTDDNASDMKELQAMIKELTFSMETMKREMGALKKKAYNDMSSVENERNPRIPRRDWKKNAECYNCGDRGHIQRESPDKKKKTESPADSKQGKQSQIKSKVGYNAPKNEAGIFVSASVYGTKVNLLVDTGATLSLLSEDVYNRICCSNPSFGGLDPVKRSVLAANDEPLKTLGRTKVPIAIADNAYDTTVFVAELTVDGVIGLDFMMANSCVVDTCNKSMLIGKETVPFITLGHIGCYKIALADTIRIPPRSAIITKGNICTPKQVKLSGEGVVEPDETFINSERGLVGKTLVTIGEQVPVRIMNISPEMKVINARTVVAHVTPIEHVLETRASSDQNSNSAALPEPVQDLLARSSEGLSQKQSREVKRLLQKFVTVFSKDDKDFGRTDIVKHSINTDSRHPIKQRLRRTPMHLEATVGEHINDMLKRDVIEPSTSPWASGIVLVKKKDGTTRFCVDYRKLNDAIIKDAYPLLRIDQTLDNLVGACWFSTLDLSSGYWQVEVEPRDQPKTAFITKRGLYQFKVMPFGLCNAPATFERLMETVLNGLQWETCLVYLDDIIVLGKSFDEMIRNLEKVFH